jgi:glycerophosphoryl diester phosphodiesterase
MSDLRTRPLRRVGHKGAHHIVPGNTRASFDAALEAGVDMIEFDVLPERSPGRRLLIAHDYDDAATRDPFTLPEALDHLAGSAFADVELDVDLKLPGYELEVLNALREADMVQRSIVSTQYPASLGLLRALEPGLRLGWSVPKLQRDPFRSRSLALAAWVGLQVAREGLPGRAARVIRAGRCDALMAHWRLVTPRLVRSVRAAGGELYVWTVDDAARIHVLEGLGVSGVITNDPRLFAQMGGCPQDETPGAD